MAAPPPPHARYHGRAMVTTRKPKSDSAAKRRSPAKRAPDSKRGAPRKRETLEAKFQRVLSEPVLDLAEWISITPAVSRLAAQWLGPMDAAQRLAHFADALIAAVATVERAILVTGDKRIARVFPVAVLEY